MIELIQGQDEEMTKTEKKTKGSIIQVNVMLK